MKRRLIALTLVFALVASMCTTAFASNSGGVPGEVAPEGAFVKYVSLGDSMANGYCFEGYEQGEDGKIDFLNGVGVYGEGAYPLQFEKYLEEKGYEVNHTKLALSALRAEDLLYLLDGRDEPTDGWQNQPNGYAEVYDDAVLQKFYQDAVTDAHIITLGIGNASFGAYMLHRVTDALGMFGASLEGDEIVTLDNALELVEDAEMKAVIYEIYEMMMAKMSDIDLAAYGMEADIDQIAGVVAYTAAGYLVNYRGSIMRILELNDDAEIILVGLMNTTYGMDIVDENGEIMLEIGDMMDDVFSVFNTYMAGIPAQLQAKGMYPDATIYYADQPNPLFISQVFDELKAEGWNAIECGDEDCEDCTDNDPKTACENGRLSGKIVRERNIQAYNDSLRSVIGAAVNPDHSALTSINLGQVEAFETAEATGDVEWDANASLNMSIAIYLAIEDAVAASCDTMEIPVSGLITIATDLTSVFGEELMADPGMKVSPSSIRRTLGAYLLDGDVRPAMCKIYALFKVGNGMSVHPTPAGHDQIFASLVEAYESENTADKELDAALNGDIATVKDIYFYLLETKNISEAQTKDIILYVYEYVKADSVDENALKIGKFIYETLLDEGNVMTDEDRIEIIVGVYEILKDAGYLAKYDDKLAVMEDICALPAMEPVSAEQAFAIVDYVYNSLDNDVDMMDIAKFIYAELFYEGELTDEQKIEIIVGVYEILKDADYLNQYDEELAMLEELVAHPAMEKVTAEQAFAIVDYIYKDVRDGDVDVREMLGYIYFEVLKAETPATEAIALLAVGDPILSAADKLAIVEAVYEVMDKYYDLESTPNLKAIKDLYDNLDPLMSDELALSIIDLAVEALVENETLGEEEIAEVAAEIADKLLAEDSELTREAKAAVLREVTNALKNTDLGETEIGGAVIPALDVIDELRTELEAYLSDEQVGEIIEIVYSFVKENDTLTEKQKAQLADKIYTIVLNRDNLTAEDKIEIITIIYTVLDEHDYVDANVAIAYMKAYAAAKEKGYIDDAALALDAVKGIVELAKVYVDMYPGSEELKALLLEELDNTEETLDALIGLLDNEVLDEAAWAELKALEDELNKHIETITELAEAMGVELDDCIADLEDAAKIYADMIADVAEAAYDYAVESIEGFADDYAEWVESVGDEIDEVNPVLGDAVRKFLTEVPADSLSILYAYGDEAVAKLVSEAVKAYGDMETVIADLAYVLNTYGEEIYEAVKGNDEIEELIEDIQDQLAEIKELVEWINDHPFEGAYNASVADKEAALQAAYDQLVYLYNRLYDVAMSVIADVDEDAAEALEAALDAMSEILCIAGESAEGYLGWLADHGEAMGCALLTALLDNIEELLTTACPIVDELIWALLAQVDQAILEFLPVADQWMYDWLYNNPDKVIAFFTEYGEEIAELAEEYGKYVAGILGYIAYTYGPEVLEYVIENPEEALEQFVAWYDKYGYRVWPMIDVYLEELGVYDAIEEGAEAVIEKIEEALEELGVQLESEIRDLIDEKLDDATHGEYTVTADSYYVAIDEMYGEDEEGYADKLAEHLGIAYNEINELDEDEIAKADLITVRYNNEPMIGVMIEDAKDYKTVEAKDWSVYVGEVGAEYVQQALAEVKAMLAEQDLGTMGDMALVAVESYAYEYVGHMINYIQDLETISEINPDALVISVGMNNALSDVVLTLDEEEIALGEYIQYVVDAANLEAFVYVLVTGNAIYVDAPAVETEFDAEESADVMDFILNLIDEESREVLLANDDGHEYIKEQILGALTITYEGLLGDANSDGVVDYVDAIYVLEYDAKLRTADELAYGLCDVNGDGAVDYVDAIFILEYDAKLITKFPAAV